MNPVGWAEFAVGVLVAAAVVAAARPRGRTARAVVLEGGGAGRTGTPTLLGRYPWGGGRAWCFRLDALRFPWRGRPKPSDAVSVLVANLGALVRAGMSPARAWEQVAQVRPAPDGVPTTADLTPLLGREAAAAVVAGCRLAVEVGAPLSGVLEQVARSIAAEADARAEREAALAGPRASARILLWLPGVGVLLGWMLGADPIGTALDGGAGSVAIVLGVALLGVGRAWSARLLDRARRAADSP